MNKKIAKTFCYQLDHSDCGVACLLSIIKYHNGHNTIENLRELSGTSKEGTTLLGLYQTAIKLNFEASGNEADLETLILNTNPLILHVVIDGHLQHYVVCYGFINEKFIIGDPAKGIVSYSKDELNKIWISKTCLKLKPTENFVKRSDIKKSKRNWFFNLIKQDIQILNISVLIGFGIALLGMAMAIFSQKLIDDILPSKEANKLIFGLALLTLMLILRVVFNALRGYLLLRQTKDFNNRIINKFYSSLLHLPKSFFDTRKIGELVARLNDTNRIQNIIKLIVSSFTIDALIVLISFGFLFYYNWVTGVIALMILPIYFITLFGFNKRIINAQKRVMESYALNESNYISTMQGIAEIKIFNKYSEFKKINEVIFGTFQNKIFDLGKINIQLTILSGILSIFFLITILSYSSYKVYQDVITLGSLMAILSIIGSLMSSISRLALISIPINEAKIAFNRMFEFTSIEKEQKGNTVITNFESIEIENLSFRFAGRCELLKNISLSINKGEFAAIVGESGCGKSTLGQILQKFYFYENGNILINKNLYFKDLKIENWRSLIGVIPQDIKIFNGNVIDNILLGTHDNFENVQNFCQNYGFEKFIKTFPQSYGTQLGEEGINLSGGQKQIIAFARALYKNPQFLILDEATAAMDRNTEKFTLDLLFKLKKNIAVLFISHRLHSLKLIADKIYILEEGIISHKGNHKVLLETPNFYSDFWSKNF